MCVLPALNQCIAVVDLSLVEDSSVMVTCLKTGSRACSWKSLTDTNAALDLADPCIISHEEVHESDNVVDMAKFSLKFPFIQKKWINMVWQHPQS